MRTIWFEYWGGMVDLKVTNAIPSEGRYLCSDDEFDYYDIDEAYIVGVEI